WWKIIQLPALAPMRKFGRTTPTIEMRGKTTRQPGISLISWREASSMNEHDVLKKNRNFYIGVGGTVLEGLLSGSLFMLLYSVMQFLWSGQFDMNRVLALTCIIAVVFLLRILIYSYGYTKAQIGGAEVSKNIR
ncbi:GerW family sporulation protein, partial [Dysosmobacter welbionis]